jgi:predicted GH43/DUF377 family glycosyl hydrolase
MGIVVVVVIFAAGLASAQTEWVTDPGAPALEPGGPGEWDESSFFLGPVVKVDGTYHLFYGAHRDGVSGGLHEINVGHATSADGIVFEKDPANPVLTYGAVGEWDDLSILHSAVIHDGLGFRMWYEGLSQTSDESSVGYATSPDGSVWTKHPGNPIFEPESPGTFDGAGVGPKTVIMQDGLYRMWYVASPTRATRVQDWTIGYAESADGLSWTRHPVPVLEPTSGWESDWLTDPSVRFDGARYEMWYTGSDRSRVYTGYAVSSDGIVWTRSMLNPVIDRESENAWVLFDADTGLYEMWYRDHAERVFRHAVSDCCSTVYGRVIPAAAYAAGAEGSFYETDLDLSNADTLNAEYRFTWLPRGASNTDPVQSEFFTLGPGKSARYSNVLAEVFDLEPDSFGALMIEASSPDLLAMARIANTPQEKVAGTFGQFIPAVTFDDLTGIHERRRLVFGTEHEDMRTNVGCVNIDPLPAGVDLELFAADGTLLGTESLILLPWSNNQINRIFEPYQPVTGYVEFWSRAESGRIYCYGSVLDNVTSDPMTVPPM